ncbi:MAG: hypothetical protein QNJ63_10720 [Calothrix sp. MO_192.B10]|nr:hypothetical protein [Calothrix sp. MO_192.B10]
MNFKFGKQSQPSNSQQIQQIKQWVYQALEINQEIPISLSQLQCTEPGWGASHFFVRHCEEERRSRSYAVGFTLHFVALAMTFPVVHLWKL